MDDSERAVKPNTKRSGAWLLAVIGVFVGVLLAAGVRMASYSPESTHYHANFAVYVNGKREACKASQYYEEVALCNQGIITPKGRAHMHSQVSDAIHVHDQAVTWGQFFANIGWTVSDKIIQTDDGTIYQATDTDQISFVLNGQTQLTNPVNRIIGDKDKLLVNYGDQDEAALQKEANAISGSAAKYDSQKDPATCSGEKSPTFVERRKHILR